MILEKLPDHIIPEINDRITTQSSGVAIAI